MSTEVIGISPEQLDTVVIERSKPHKPLPPADTTHMDKVPIDWNPTVEDWEETDTVNVKSNFN